jgi:hypothetical protein
MLQDDAEVKTCGVHGFHALPGTLDTYFDRFLQKHMLAGSRTAPDEIEMRRRRRKENDSVDGRVAEDCFEIIRDGQIGICLREGGSALVTWRITGCDLNAIVQLAQTLQVRLVSHAEPDEADAMPCTRHSP